MTTYSVYKENFFRQVGDCLGESNIDKKIDGVAEIYSNLEKYSFEDNPELDIDIPPGIPEKPGLVEYKKLPKRGYTEPEKKNALIHSLAHIEFNAINLALDAIYRFREMPSQFHIDWLEIANEEKKHFCLLRKYLNKHGYDYGDFAAHDGLWRIAEQTSDDVLARMAVVPRIMEARGLDVTPEMIVKFRQVKDIDAVNILEKIYHDEINHVRKGSYWFNYICDQRKLDRTRIFRKFIRQYMGDALRTNLNLEARFSAGFTNSEVSFLQDLS